MPLRVAWFSPLPPDRTGVAAYSAELVPALRADFDIDLYPERDAHDFVWRHRRAPYDLTVFHLGNAPCHDYMWGYLVRYPGLVVLHDARLHHARARQLLRPDDPVEAAHRIERGQAAAADRYRAEFRFDQPAAPAGVEEYAVQGLGGSLNYFWPMLRVPVTTARAVAVHNARVAADLADEYPSTAIHTIRMGVPDMTAPADARIRVRRSLGIPDDAVVFAVFGKVTREKRVAQIAEALTDVRGTGVDARLLIVGEGDEASADGETIVAAGYVADVEVATWLSAADVSLCLRWPTALETSAGWLRCLAAGRATVIANLAHLADVPDGVALRIDLLDERRQLASAMGALARDPAARARLARNGRAYWQAHHTIDHMAADYRAVLAAAAARPAPHVALPAHLEADHGALARDIARRFGVDDGIIA